MDAYLHHCLALPRLQRDLLAQAASEILADLTPPQAPYAADLAGSPTSPAPDTASQNGAAPVQDCDILDHRDPRTPEN
ncbi:hypothetical protein [Kocuria arenosa]|uniref:hypothetical protein n=1 Tax=Kocuria arenosa TaxID=3071446 RepID=UPI0034D7B5D7